MSTSEVDTLRRLLEASFSGADEHALLTNVASVPDTAWNARPEGISRSVRDIVIHLAACNFLGRDYLLRAPPAEWDPDRMFGAVGRETVMGWLESSHAQALEAGAGLDDADLNEERTVSRGNRCTVRELIETAIAHNHYHAGEVNHLRSLISGEDRWAHAIATNAGGRTGAVGHGE